MTRTPQFVHFIRPRTWSSSAFKARYCGELVDKRHKRAADLENLLSCADIRDIADLKVGDIKELD